MAAATASGTARRATRRTPPKIDLEELARAREERYERRRARIEADANMEPERKALYLERTIVDSEQAAVVMDVGQHRVYELRGGRGTKTPRRSPHPAILPEMDTVVGWVADVPSPGVEIGRLYEWCEQRGTHDLDLATGKLVKNPNGGGHGRKRHGRLAQSKPNVPGTKKKTTRKRTAPQERHAA